MRQVEAEILRDGPRLRNCLLEHNPVLSPDQLDQYFELYADFYPDRTGLIWSKNPFEKVIVSRKKRFFLISGPAASGKHALINALKRLLGGQIYSLVTTTTRLARDNEREGIDHYYSSLEEFQKDVAAGKFIETMPEGENWYGTPKKSIDAALKQEKPIIVSDVEIGNGWPAVKKYVANLPVDTTEIFVLPTISAKKYFLDWLPAHRLKDFDYRGKRSAWEIIHAPERARFLITNYIENGLAQVDLQAQTLSDILCLWPSSSRS